MEIKKVKLRDGMFANIEYSFDTGTTVDQITRVCNNPVHPDFKVRMQALAVHAVLITELADPVKVKDLDEFHSPLLDKVSVKGISIGGESEEGVTITFELKLSTGRVININTPFTKYYEENNGYRFGSDLQIHVDEFLTEVEAYLNGKYGEGTQLQIEFDENEEAPI